MCGSQALLEKDHRVPASLGGSGEDNFQLLCSACHLAKTRDEGAAHAHCRGNTLNPMLSYFCQQTWKDFVEANHPKQVVMRMHKPQQKQGLLVDVKACRRRALTSGWELPVFAATDMIRPFTMDALDADFFYVRREGKRLLDMLPYTGARWYHRMCVLYLLETKRICYADILYSFAASGHLPADAFESPNHQVER